MGCNIARIGGMRKGKQRRLQYSRRLRITSKERSDEYSLWRLSAHLLFLWHEVSVVVASTCVRVRSCVRCRRRGSRNGWAERQGTLFFFLPFPSATLDITYILHWVIRPWLSHVFIRFIGHKALIRKGDKPVPILG